MININKQKVLSKWSPILEKMGVSDPTRRDWMSEYAEYHQISENVGYSNLSNLSGMGGVVSPQPSGIPGQAGYGTGVAGGQYGQNGVIGSGDIGQQLLPVAMKVAAQTIGLDLVHVKPTAGPVIDLMYVDYRYDDGAANSDEYNPIVFKLDSTDNGVTVDKVIAAIKVAIAGVGVTELRGGLSARVFFNLPAGNGRLAGGVTAITVEPENKEGVIEFLGFSRIDGLPMFKAFRATNAAAQGVWRFNAAKNTFGETEQVKTAFSLSLGTAGTAGAVLAANTLSFGTAGVASVSLVSALEDHLPGFVKNGGKHAMPREMDETTYPGVIAPNVTTKRVTVGTISVSSALKITEIEDIKAQTGIDIVQKLQGVLVNELSQTISREIVDKVFAMGDMNRKSAPKVGGTGASMFDFDVDAYLGSNAPGGETSASVQRKLVTKIKNASNFIAQEGRVGPASYIVTNGTLAAALTEGSSWTLQPEQSSSTGQGQLYPMGKVANMTVYVDPYMNYNDSRILVGRKNTADQPGVVFVPYLMAQNIQLISEATFAPRMLLRSRYAVTEVGHFPQKQYMTIHVTDTKNILA
jgi:hypothetical protein